MDFKEISNNIKGYLYEKRHSPFFVTFIITWIAYNWKAILFLYSDSNIEIIKRIQLVEKIYIKPIYIPFKDKNYLIGWENLYTPIIIALTVFLIGNILSLSFRRIKLIFENIQKQHIDKYELLSVEENEKARNGLREYENKINLQGADLNRQIESLNTTLNLVRDENISLKKENIEVQSLTEKLKNAEFEINSKNQQIDLDKKAIKKLEEENKSLNENPNNKIENLDNFISDLGEKNKMKSLKLEYVKLKTSDYYLSFLTFLNAMSNEIESSFSKNNLTRLLNNREFSQKEGFRKLEDLQKIEIIDIDQKYDIISINNKGKEFVKLYLDENNPENIQFSHSNLVKAIN